MAPPNLRMRREVRRLYQTGRIHKGRWLHVRIGASEISRTIIAVRRRYGGAVGRNRARRRIRSICREFLPDGHPGRLLLISVSDGAGSAGHRDLRTDVREAFVRLGLLVP